MPGIDEFLGTINYYTASDGMRGIITPTVIGSELTTSGFDEDPSAFINATGGTTFEASDRGFGPNMRKDVSYGGDYFPSGCSATLDGVDESTSAGWLISQIVMENMSAFDSYVKCTLGPFNIELHVTRGDPEIAYGRVYTLIFTWPGGSYTQEVPKDNYSAAAIVIAMNGSKVGFWAETMSTLRFLAEYDFVTVPKNYVYSDFEMYSPDSNYYSRTRIGYQRQFWGGDAPPEPVVAGGIRPLRKFQTLTGSPGGGRPLRKFQNGGHSGGRPLRKFATGI